MIALRSEVLGEIASIHGFIEQLLDLRASIEDQKVWYRGVEDEEFKLTPTIGRNDDYLGPKTSYTFTEEWQLLHRFRRRAHQQFGRVLPAGEALFVGRHHGLPTRLLDWTANALYGLHFACRSEPKKDGVLWGMKGRKDREFLDCLEIDRIADEMQLFAKLDGRQKRYAKSYEWRDRPRSLKLLEPPFNSPRLLAQDGVFTVHNCPHIPLEDFVGFKFEPKNLDVEVFFKWTIPGDCKRTLIKQLNGLGITRRSVYPDVDGIAVSLKETELLWSKRKARPARP
jgi:hypothetical protein